MYRGLAPPGAAHVQVMTAWPPVWVRVPRGSKAKAVGPLEPLSWL